MAEEKTTVVATVPKHSLVSKFASKYSVEPEKLLPILKATAFKVKEGEVSNEQMAALLIVADQYGLNPFTKEIFAFPDKKNGIVPVVGVDGWSRIINDHPQSDGFEFRSSEKMITMPDAVPCPEWMEVVIHRKDRTHAIVVREYLDEVYRPLGTYKDGNKHNPGPWQTHTKRFLRHKTLIQGGRIAYGFGGIYDEDEAERIMERDVTAEGSTEFVEQPKRKSAEQSSPPAVSSGDTQAAGGSPAPACRPPEREPVPDAIPTAASFVDGPAFGQPRPAEAPKEEPPAIEGTADIVPDDDSPFNDDPPFPVDTAATPSEPRQPATGPAMSQVQKNIILNRLARAALTEVDLGLKFGKLDELKASEFNAVQDWIKSKAK